MVRLVAAFPSSYSKPPGSVNMRELLKKMKNFYKLKSLQVMVTFRKYFICFFKSNAIFLLSSILCENKPDDVDPLRYPLIHSQSKPTHQLSPIIIKNQPRLPWRFDLPCCFPSLPLHQ